VYVHVQAHEKGHVQASRLHMHKWVKMAMYKRVLARWRGAYWCMGYFGIIYIWLQ
jgi:hypothetical protein